MIIQCEERLAEAKKHAEKTKDKSLQDCLDRLEQWEKNNDSVIYLRKDFAPLSFYFEMFNKDRQRIMNGGLLYHGSPDQSRAVILESFIGWSIHT